MTEELTPLSKKHQAVLDKYVVCWSQTDAYREVYPSASYASAKASAARLFADVNFRAHLQERLDEIHMSANEALKLQADIARGDIGDFMDISSVGFSLDLQSAREQGKTKLIKKVKQKTTTFIAKKESEEDREVTEIEIELYPADSAQERILRAHGVFKDNIKIEGGLEIITKRVGVDLGKI